MLTLTESAADAIKGFVQESGLPEEAGLRIQAELISETEGTLGLTIVEQPEAADQVIEEKGAHVFVDDGLAPLLEDKVLDAELHEEGVAFTLREQGPEVNGAGRDA